MTPIIVDDLGKQGMIAALATQSVQSLVVAVSEVQTAKFLLLLNTAHEVPQTE